MSLEQQSERQQVWPPLQMQKQNSRSEHHVFGNHTSPARLSYCADVSDLPREDGSEGRAWWEHSQLWVSWNHILIPMNWWKQKIYSKARCSKTSVQICAVHLQITSKFDQRSCIHWNGEDIRTTTSQWFYFPTAAICVSWARQTSGHYL